LRVALPRFYFFEDIGGFGCPDEWFWLLVVRLDSSLK
jgi:hypothetical protein